MKRAFTLLELLVIVAIMGTMVTLGIVSLQAGQGAVRVKGATRDIFAAIRHARSTALVTQQPAIITYSTEEVDGEVVAKVEITSAKLMTEGVDPSKVRTLSGDRLKSVATVSAVAESESEDVQEADASKGRTLEDVLFAPIDVNVVKGMRVKVLVGGGELNMVEDRPKPKISVFSNVDYLLGKFKESKKSATVEKQTETKKAGSDEKDDAKVEDQEPVSVVWSSNGRVEPHQVWVYPDGKHPEDGLSIKIDAFGAAKVISADGREED